MVSVNAEKWGLENREWSYVGGQPKFKRRRVSAIRDFPLGCGPNVTVVGPRMNEKVSFCITGLSNGQVGEDMPVLEVEVKLENEVDEWWKDEMTACSNRVENGELMGPEDGGVNHLGDDALLQESNHETCKPSQALVSESFAGESVRESSNLSKDLALVVLNGTNMEFLNFKDKVKVVEATTEVVVESGEETCSLPYYPIPSGLIWKKIKYPPRRRFSAIRDYPAGCGHASVDNSVAGRLKTAFRVNNHLSGGNSEAEKCGDIVRSVMDEIREQFEDDDVLHSEGKGKITVETIHHLQVQSKLNTVTSGEMNVKSIEIIGASVSKEHNGNHIVNSYTVVEKKSGHLASSIKGERNEALEAKLDKRKEVTMKDKNNRRKLIGVSGSNRLQTEQMAALGDVEDVVVVQGLMAPPNCPWRQGRAAAKPVLSTSAGKGNRLKIGSSEQNKVLKKKLVENRSPVMEKYTYEGAGQLVLRDEMETSEDDDQKQLARSSHDFDLSLPPTGATSSSDKGSRRPVREALRLFQAIVRKLTQEEESKRKGKGTGATRVDQVAAKILKDSGKYVNTGKPIIGTVPGVEVGDEFHYRVELMIIGLHRPSMAGIDSVKRGEKLLATSVVASGRYDNEVESSDSLIYTGQGGTKSGDKEHEDQKLERGNLALKNSFDEKNYVRVIRGYREMKSSECADSKVKMVATYTYDGLYTVENYWQEVAPYGKMVYKFELKRLPGQPELAWKEVKKSNKLKERPGRCVDDITEGKEVIPISVVNTIDNEKPPAFTYISSMMFPDWYCPVPPKGCDCVGGCSDSEKCACTVKNGGEIPYNFNGAIVEAKSLVYECGPCCKCPPPCHNRVSQHGIKFPLEVFKTETRGWGIRSLSSIPSGSFICEYIGELLEDKEAEQRTGNDEYLFDIGQNYDDQGLRQGVSTLMPDSSPSSVDFVEQGYTIDAAKYGNVARFINHSCSPNLYAQNVLYDNDDKRFPHIMLFAAENIPPLQELTYHYNYIIDQVRDSMGNIKVKECYCGSSDCTGRMY